MKLSSAVQEFRVFSSIGLLFIVHGAAATLSLADHNIAHDHQITLTKVPIESPCRPGRWHGEAFAPRSFLQQIRREAGLEEDTKAKSQGGATLPTTYMTKTSELHADHYSSGDPLSTGDLVSILLLNTNEDAYFIHGETSVPIVKDRLVTFDGSLPHQTVVGSGAVAFLGPFDMQSFRRVGDPCDADNPNAATFVIPDDLTWETCDSNASCAICVTTVADGGMRRELIFGNLFEWLFGWVFPNEACPATTTTTVTCKGNGRVTADDVCSCLPTGAACTTSSGCCGSSTCNGVCT